MQAPRHWIARTTRPPEGRWVDYLLDGASVCISSLRRRRRRRVHVLVVIVRMLVFCALLWFMQDLLYRGYDVTTATSTTLVLLGAAMQASRSLVAMPAAATREPLLR